MNLAVRACVSLFGFFAGQPIPRLRGPLACAVLVFASDSVLLAQSSIPKGPWDKVDIVAKAIAGVLIPIVVAWAVNRYNKAQRELENQRNKAQHDRENRRQNSDLMLRQLDCARQFLPLLLSKDILEKWNTLNLIRSLGDEDLARKIARWLVRGYWRTDERALIERLINDEDPYIAEMAKEAFSTVSSPPAEVGRAVSVAAETGYNKLKTTGDIACPGKIRFQDAAEQHGQWVISRKPHDLVLPVKFRIGIYLITNEFFLEFVKDGGYSGESYWRGGVIGVREKCLSQDGQTLGPSTWPSGKACQPGKERHPVAGIGHYEARAFCEWLQQRYPPSEAEWKWRLPTEDMWELTARTKEGLLYPWGQEFSTGRCNSLEAGIGTTTDVCAYPAGPSGCFDMAGNIWEFVDADDQQQWVCVLKGGSFRNDRHLVKSSLRLFGVPKGHRPPDFVSGFPRYFSPARLSRPTTRTGQLKGEQCRKGCSPEPLGACVAGCETRLQHV